MEETHIEIPDSTEDGWQPPVLKKVPAVKKPTHASRCTDIFFVQYAVCVLLLTSLLLLKLYHPASYADALSFYRTLIQAPTEPCIAALLAVLTP